MRYKSGLTLISVSFFLLQLTNPAAANAQAGGPWKGSTSQGEKVSFRVSSNQISGFTIALQLPNGLVASYTDENLAIDNLNFSFVRVLTGTSCIVSVNGTFLSDTSAAGTIATSYCLNDPNLLVIDTTWTAAPEITATSVSPNSGMAGSTASITLQGVGFVPDDTVVQVSGTGITVTNLQVTSSSSLTATLNTDWNAAPGERIISVGTSSFIGGGVPFTVTPNPNVYPMAVPDKGGLSLSTPGTSTSSVTGSLRVSAIPGGAKLAGTAIFGLRSRNVLVTEAGVQASVPILRGRIFAEVGGDLNTGLAIANPNSDKATISFFFTNPDGSESASGTINIPPNGQIAKFLNDTPFNSGTIQGTMTFSSDMPVAATAIRTHINERGEFLITSLPVVDLSVGALTVDITVPDFVDGGGYTTTIILVNATDLQLTGRISFLDMEGVATSVTIAGSSSDTFSYSIPRRGSVKVVTEGSAQTVRSGSVRILPGLGGFAPASLAVFSFKPGAVTVSEAGVAGTPMGSNVPLRMYIEAAGFYGDIGSIQTGIAIANAAATSNVVTLEATHLDGTQQGLVATITLQPYSQTTKFLNQVFSTMPRLFKGVLRISSSAPISVVGLRGRYNERSDFLMTTIQPVSETAGSSSPAPMLVFPHFAEGGGYSTQFVLISTGIGQTTGALAGFSQAGQLTNLNLR